MEPAAEAVLPEQFRLGAALGDAAVVEVEEVFPDDAGDADPLALSA